MAKQSMIQRELKRIKLVKKYSKKRTEILLKLKETKTLSEVFKWQEKLQSLPKNSLPIRVRNRCWKTGRGKSVFRDFGLCRNVVREMANQGLLPGVVKSSW